MRGSDTVHIFLVHITIQCTQALKELTWEVKQYSTGSMEFYTIMTSLVGVSCNILTVLLSEECGHILFSGNK